MWTLPFGRCLSRLAVSCSSSLTLGAVDPQLGWLGPRCALSGIPTDPNRCPTGAWRVASSPCFEGCESVSGVGLARIPSFGVV